MQHEPSEFRIRREQVERLARYLAARPWAEVNELIVLLSELPPVEVERKLSEVR